MSVHGMKPHFVDQAGYIRWKSQWRVLYDRISSTIRDKKLQVKALQRTRGNTSVQKALGYERVMAHKLMTVRAEAVARWQRIVAMRRQLEEQNATFPLVLEGCRTVDFHFNRGHNEFAELPMWIVKAKGRTFYVKHVSADVPWTTRETEKGSTKGMMRFRDCDLVIDASAEATITRTREAMAEAA